MTTRMPSKPVLLAARVVVGGTQLLAFSVCTAAAINGVWVSWIGAASTLVVAFIMFFSPATEAT